MGIFLFDGQGHIAGFEEKPNTAGLQEMRSSVHEGASLPGMDATKPYIASMGIYVFSRQVLLGADFYQEPRAATSADIRLGIGRDVVLDRVIVDKNAHIGDGSRLTNERKLADHDGDGYYIRDGIIVVPKGSTVPAGTII